jgi:hypothetical protein
VHQRQVEMRHGKGDLKFIKKLCFGKAVLWIRTDVFGPSGSVIICTDPDPFIIKKNSKKNLDFYFFVTSL